MGCLVPGGMEIQEHKQNLYILKALGEFHE